MAARAYWQGQIRLALVSIPVEIYTATKSGAQISFHQIHEPSGKRIKYEKVAPGVGAVEPDEIVKAVRTIALGRRYITPAVADLLANQLGKKENTAPHEQLSEREFQVFLRLAQGETIGVIADSLSLSVKTVSTYRTRIMEKMSLESNSDLTYYALKNGLIQ